jgi:hypothetical protein
MALIATNGPDTLPYSFILTVAISVWDYNTCGNHPNISSGKRAIREKFLSPPEGILFFRK